MPFSNYFSNFANESAPECKLLHHLNNDKQDVQVTIYLIHSFFSPKINTTSEEMEGYYNQQYLQLRAVAVDVVSDDFLAYRRATTAPLMLCHTLKMAPGMVAIG